MTNLHGTRSRSSSDITTSNIYDNLHEEEDDCESCRVCMVTVLSENDSIKCARCEGWVHSEKKCSDLTKGQFDFLKKHVTPAIQFVCSKCRDVEDTREAVARNTAKLDSVGQSIAELKHQSNLILNYMKTSSKTNDSVKTLVAEAIGDERARGERENNVIMYNVPESDPKANDALAEAEVIQNVTNVITFVEKSIDTSSLNGKTVMRLGPKRVPSEDNPHPKPRPVKVIFRNSIEAGLIKKNARKLKFSDGLKHVGISADKTWKEREEERETRKVYNQRKFENHEDVVIYNSEVILRSELPSMLKKAKESVSGAGGAAAQKDDRINVGN